MRFLQPIDAQLVAPQTINSPDHQLVWPPPAPVTWSDFSVSAFQFFLAMQWHTKYCGSPGLMLPSLQS
jgi:hypothetical protein